MATLEEDEVEFRAGDVVRGTSDEVESIYIVKEGWLFSAVELGDGRRQILEFFVPGDVVGLHDLPYEQTSYELVTLTESTLCPFPKERLGPVFETSRAVTGLLFTFSLIDHVIMLDRLKSIGRLAAKDRIAHLMLTVRSRLCITNDELGDHFFFPIPQAEMADALGLTPVTISRSKAELQQEGLIRWQRREVELLDRAALEKRTRFDARYQNLDTSWFTTLCGGY
ncbi:Crp/Fnr family transcriptional regulator [Parvularcula maris]|nr:Crp/Fnr family transcriptional regulator [Parvularcula maris]